MTAPYLDYLDRGWCVLPIHKGEKRPRGNEWQALRLDASSAVLAFSGVPSVGVHLGPSGLIDIDLDCDLAVRVASKLLPETATFGRPSNPRSHWIYQGAAEYRKFVDPVDGDCLLELRSGEGKQTVFPGSIHPSGEEIKWSDATPIQPAPEDLPVLAGQLAQLVWQLKHDTTEMPDRVQSWTKPKEHRATQETPALEPDQVRVSAPVEELTQAIADRAPEKGSRHDYRLRVAGAMLQNGYSQEAAESMLVDAMSRIGGSEEDARAAVADTYRGGREIAGTGSLVMNHGPEVAAKIQDVAAPKIDELQTWTDRLYDECLGSNIEPLADPEFLRELSQMTVKRDHRIHTIWAKLKESGWAHCKGFREAVDDCARAIKKNREAMTHELEPCQHPEAAGMYLPAGCWLSEDRRLYNGEDLVTAGQLELLAKCPSSDGVQVRIAFRPGSSEAWKTTVLPYRYLIDSKYITALAAHGINCSSLESSQIVAFCRDYVATNERLLDRPVATSTGWHNETGAFIWGRNVIGGPPELRAEFAIDNQIGTQYVAALNSAGDREKSFAAMRQVVETLPGAALCLTASLAACWTIKLARPCVGVHLGGVGGTGKTRSLKIAASVWGANGSSGGNSASGTIAGANSTVRAMEIAASVRNDLPFFLSDLRPFRGLPEVLHGILNSDPRARATTTGGSTMGDRFRCGALITEGELNVKALTARQGFHRRVIEIEPDAANMQDLWDLGEVCSENYGHLGPAFVELGPPPSERFHYWRERMGALGAERALTAATLMAVAEHAADLLGADLSAWQKNITKCLVDDRNEAETEGGTQAQRAEHELEEVLLELAPQIAHSQEATHHTDVRPWVGFEDSEAGRVYVSGAVLRKALQDRGHDAITSVLRHLHRVGRLENSETKNASIGGRRIRCYVVIADNDGELK